MNDVGATFRATQMASYTQCVTLVIAIIGLVFFISISLVAIIWCLRRQCKGCWWLVIITLPIDIILYPVIFCFRCLLCLTTNERSRFSIQSDEFGGGAAGMNVESIDLLSACLPVTNMIAGTKKSGQLGPVDKL